MQDSAPTNLVGQGEGIKKRKTIIPESERATNDSERAKSQKLEREERILRRNKMKEP